MNAILRAQVLDILLRHLVSNVIGLTNRERDDCQGRIFCCAGCELAAVRNEQVFDIMSLPPLVANSIPRVGVCSTSLSTCSLASSERSVQTNPARHRSKPRCSRLGRVRSGLRKRRCEQCQYGVKERRTPNTESNSTRVAITKLIT